MGRYKTVIFWIFHIIMKILPAISAFAMSKDAYAEFSSGSFFNIYLLAGYLFIAFAVASCFIDYRFIRKDKENGSTNGVKKILIIDGILLLATAALFIYLTSQSAYIYGMGFFEFLKFKYIG